MEELGHKIVKLHELSSQEKGINVNVGLIEGGTAVNTVASEAIAHVDLRIRNQSQAQVLEEKMRELSTTPDVLGTTITLEGGIERPPMEKTEQTERLLHVVQQVGNEMGLKITDTATGGGSDASFTASKIPTIDGLGPVGGNAHSENEYLEIPTLVQRTCLLASVMQRLTENGL
ncbi:M20/M25/M40 family metallo-hydrolase [Paracerasibacillus soli]|uniref:M20/M25/M40 family metallo-hydrolase n=1 Tax=Paracerasibacillus soli TaxID=480284 RepID=A0ABU5CTG5_9BACI|nr:M20/M25/M40 family metallo-hydrolase [Virgibacillus soli]MDY0409137.1 M20/M25/M40 family metallo-hydrolase [Virgibacillus soli]